MASPAATVARTLVGEPLRSDRLEETLLPKRLALPVFCSDPLSSVAYATEQILLVLALGGLALLHVAPESVATTIAIVGVATALFAATVACAQDDIKRVLAYSTISQLGFMFLAIGSAAAGPRHPSSIICFSVSVCGEIARESEIDTATASISGRMRP